ncbi:hypothetical protein AB1N83_012599, partial [Pleurotus pulmonarius]
SLMATAQS